jgi:acyl carrier protein
MKTADEIESWLRAYLAKELGVKVDEVAADTPFLELGLGSRQAVLMAGDLEDWLGREVEAGVAWEHPSIRELAGFLADS